MVPKGLPSRRDRRLKRHLWPSQDRWRLAADRWAHCLSAARRAGVHRSRCPWRWTFCSPPCGSLSAARWRERANGSQPLPRQERRQLDEQSGGCRVSRELGMVALQEWVRCCGSDGPRDAPRSAPATRATCRTRDRSTSRSPPRPWRPRGLIPEDVIVGSNLEKEAGPWIRPSLLELCIRRGGSTIRDGRSSNHMPPRRRRRSSGRRT